MKKIIVLALSAAFVLSVGVFSACAHRHTYASEWTADETDHWHAVTCGHADAVEKAEHTFDSGRVTAPATHTTAGVKTYKCTVCGYEKTEDIPANVNEHTYATEWTADETDHWHAVTCGHADAVEKAEHEWQTEYDAELKVWNEVCGVCDYKKANSAVNAGVDEAHPIPVYTAEDYCAITSGTGDTARTYYKLMNDITLDASYSKQAIKAKWGTAYVVGSLGYTKFIELNGGGHTITSLTDAWLFDFLMNSAIKDLKVNARESLVARTAKVTMENVDVYGDMFWNGGNRGVYVVYAQQGLTLTNCTNYATVNCTGDDKSYNAVFVGCPSSTAKYMKQTLKFENCKNAGKFTSGKAAMFVANAYQAANFTSLDIINCGNIQGGEVRGTIVKAEGKINPFCAEGVNLLSDVKVDGEEKEITDCGAMGAGFVNGPQDVMNLTENADGTFSFNKSEKENVAYYVVSAGLYTNWSSGGLTGTNRVYATERIEATGAESYVTALKNLSFVDDKWVAANTSAEKGELAGNAVYTLEGVTYYLVEAEGCDVGGTAKAASIFSVSAYSADGTLISSVGL